MRLLSLLRLVLLTGIMPVLLTVKGPSAAFADHKDVIVLKSYNNFEKTLETLEKAIKEKNLTLFSKIDHQAGALSAGERLEPATLVIFGNPRAGTPLMQRNLLSGLDLPLKMLVSENKGLVQISFREPMALARDWHFGEPIPSPLETIIARMRTAVFSLAYQAANRLEEWQEKQTTEEQPS